MRRSALATPFDRRSLRERCIDFLRAEIISGALKPGEHIIESEVSERLGVSRGTLREALRSIENEGLVENDGKGHVMVRTLSADQIADVFEVRTALEVLAATKLAQSPRREEFAAALTDALRPLERDDLSFADRIQTDVSFHEQLCTLTGSATLLSAWRPLIGQIRMMIIAAGPDRATGRMRFEDHVVIAEAIRTGDVPMVRRVLEEHMGYFAEAYGREAVADTASVDA